MYSSFMFDSIAGITERNITISTAIRPLPCVSQHVFLKILFSCTDFSTKPTSFIISNGGPSLGYRNIYSTAIRYIIDFYHKFLSHVSDT